MERKRAYAQYRIPLDLFNRPSYFVWVGIMILAIAWLVFMLYIKQFGDLAELGGVLSSILIFTMYFAAVGRYAYRGANRWVLNKVRCPICEGVIEKCECDITGKKGVMHCVLNCRNCKRTFFLVREEGSDVFNLKDYSKEEYSDLIDSNVKGGV